VQADEEPASDAGGHLPNLLALCAQDPGYQEATSVSEPDNKQDGAGRPRPSTLTMCSCWKLSLRHELVNERCSGTTQTPLLGLWPLVSQRPALQPRYRADPVSEVEVEEPWQAEGEESELDGDDDNAKRSMEVFLTDREVTDMAYVRNWVWARTGHNAWDSDIADTMMRKHPSRNFSISDWHTAYLSNIRRIDYAAKHRVRERMTVKDESME
ncbi:hypothetical protein EXIGLDRAFT_694446, partial [Exidia glandulosa HHB12029]